MSFSPFSNKVPVVYLALCLIGVSRYLRPASSWTIVPPYPSYRHSRQYIPNSHRRRRCRWETKIDESRAESGVAEGSDGNAGAGNNAWRLKGDEVIKGAAVSVGAREEDIGIEWKNGRIIVTVTGEAYVSAGAGEEEEEETDYDDEEYFEEEEEEEVEEEGEEDVVGADVTSITRAINQAFAKIRDEEGESSIGWNIATNYEIEVTTPGFDGVFRTDVMFLAYRGFDVIVEYFDKKKGKKTAVEGKLVERDEEKTTINVKGRMRKIKNEIIDCVKLPKAKREKGVR
mmetsp:Transcript_38130/g.46520  ORF Transcript_38130/g.46520 Transcript_38130/m.46520 type:complete len:286 (+) Transcript_38130:248-1105(+)|eukprot:CAMPEP_0172499024 /NCGR_PEP_ID=MMETSP1066-20121228/121138_1 /TAXON_ID=671091 /ORGANISM="Coscinodiscus wailesii, Strain CCMP2513" /LENGTH=285 /DNA_ID=CAMNT_0013272557 /DNA_START=243 /DNA_END=1100 /DNA_ORIENTATION=+